MHKDYFVVKFTLFCKAGLRPGRKAGSWEAVPVVRRCPLFIAGLRRCRYPCVVMRYRFRVVMPGCKMALLRRCRNRPGSRCRITLLRQCRNRRVIELRASPNCATPHAELRQGPDSGLDPAILTILSNLVRIRAIPGMATPKIGVQTPSLRAIPLCHLATIRPCHSASRTYGERIARIECSIM